jgi:hypothetical protein
MHQLLAEVMVWEALQKHPCTPLLRSREKRWGVVWQKRRALEA